MTISRASGLIQHHPAHPAEQHGQRRGNEGRQRHAVETGNIPVADEYQTDLSGHGPEYHPEVQPHACHDRNKQRKHEEGVTRKPGQHFLNQIRGSELGIIYAEGTHQEKHNGHGIPDAKEFDGFAAGHFFHDLTFVTRVRA